MNFQYVQTQLDNFSTNILDSSLSVVATVFIAAGEVTGDSFYRGFGDSLDGREDSIKRNYPADLKTFYRIKVFPIDKSGLSSNFIQKPVGYTDTYDLWIYCLEEVVKVRNDSTYFDFAEYVHIQGIKYNIKAIVKEIFGNKPILYIFLTKKTEL